jgi:hypothetical protein
MANYYLWSHLYGPLNFFSNSLLIDGLGRDCTELKIGNFAINSTSAAICMSVRINNW